MTMTADPDPALKRFEDLDYPGRRKPVNRDKQPARRDTEVWDAKPTFYLIKGERQEFFTIRQVAAALGYSVQSIRAWEAAGLMPRTPFRSPPTRGPVAAGRSTKGRRLWTREQVLGILDVAKKHKVILNRQPPTKDFAKEVNQLFKQLTAPR